MHLFVRTFQRDGAKVLVDAVSFEFLKGSTVAYTQDMVKNSFAVTQNPNAESRCGCHSSFAVKS